MRRRGAFFFFALALLQGGRALAGDDPFSLDDDDAKPATPSASAPASASASASAPAAPFSSGPVPTIKPHAYTLAECLALADRNFPNLWAARARLAYAHSQLDEAKWLPYFQWNVSSNFAVIGPINGTPMYTSAPQSARNISFTDGIQPLWSVDLSGVLPIYTFGKITAGRQAAEANVRLNEWDLEHWRQQSRMDVRRAYFGAMLARDGRYILTDVLERIDKAIRETADKITAREPGYDEVDRLRLAYYRDTVQARAGDPDKGERYAMAALRFYTGVQTAFDIPDEPMKRPDTPISPLVRYLAAARVFRPEVNMAKAGIAARQAQVDLARANLFPDIGVGFGASYAIAPSAVPQYQSVWAMDPFNHFYAGAGFGVRWGLDLLPKQARVGQAESQLEEARALERMALGGIAVEVENAYGTLVEADNREQSWDRAEHRAKQWIVTVQDAIDLGSRNERDLIEPLRAYMDARVNHVFALMDLNVAMSDLARVSGVDTAAPSGQ
jgi:outer membrane protein TolC